MALPTLPLPSGKGWIVSNRTWNLTMFSRDGSNLLYSETRRSISEGTYSGRAVMTLSTPLPRIFHWPGTSITPAMSCRWISLMNSGVSSLSSESKRKSNIFVWFAVSRTFPGWLSPRERYPWFRKPSLSAIP